MSVAGDYIGRVRLGVTIGAAGSQSFTWPDGRPDGTYTADAGPDGVIVLEVDVSVPGALTVSWAADQARRMIGHPWRVLRDGTWLFGDLYVTEAEPSDDDPADFTVLDGAVEVTVAMVAPGTGGVTDHGALTGRDDADQHPASAITVGADTLEEYLAARGTGTLHRVGLFVADVDASGGSFTAVDALGAGSVPREYIVGTPVLVLSGDDLGIWAITASGPCTPGVDLAAGDVIASFGGQLAGAASLGGPLTILVAANRDELLALTAQVESAADSATASAGAARLRTDIITQALVSDSPTAWSQCGGGADDDPTFVSRGHWSCSTLVPTAEHTVAFEGTVRVMARSTPDREQGHFYEGNSEALDGDVGVNDLMEPAIWDDEVGELLVFGEATEAGQTNEWWKRTEGQTLYSVSAPGIPRQTWVKFRVEFDADTHTMHLRVRTDGFWDWTDPDGDHWQTVLTYVNPLLDSFAASTAIEQWIGRGGGWHDHARWRRWRDGVLVSDWNPANSTTPGEIPDAVLESAPGVPAVWLAQDGPCTIVEAEAPGGGAVDSVNGETGTVVLTASDVGAAATSHTHAASDITSGTLDIARIPTGATGSTVPFGNDARLSDTRTPTDGTVTAAKLDGALAARIPTTVWADTDSAARTTAASKADDSELKFAGAANTRYRVDMHLQFSGDATADVTIGVTGPTGATCSLFMDYFGGAVAAASAVAQQGAHISTVGAGGAIGAGVIASPGLAYRLSGWVQLSSTAGDVSLYWGPTSNGAGTGVIRHANSHLIHTP